MQGYRGVVIVLARLSNRIVILGCVSVPGIHTREPF